MTDVRQATEADLVQLPEVERAADGVFAAVGITGLPPAASIDELNAAADGVFAAVGITGLPPAASIDELRAAAAVLVAGQPPVGFARVDLVCGEAYLAQLSVHPDAMRRGIGSALLSAACDWAADNGHPTLLLATFQDVAWNAPFYAQHGFEVVDATTPATLAVARHEDELGMSKFGARVLMRRTLTNE